MLVSDILKSCSHERVAEAAVASIGGDFAHHVRRRAGERGHSVGGSTANHVKQFSRQASKRDGRLLLATLRGEDLALLAGLQAVMVRKMADGTPVAEAQSRAVQSEAEAATVAV